VSTSPFAVGIDLGTTHSALSFVDVRANDGDVAQVRELAIPQSVAAGSVESRALLPSFLYLPHASEFGPQDLALPWDGSPRVIVGEMARQVGAKTPIRLVSSAKSWLGHSAVDRRGPILPADAPPEVERVSPFEASVRYLSHLRATWDAANPSAPLATQEVVLTVPASFDPAARELTAAAAQQAGIQNLVLLEEPQAALYSWIAGNQASWRTDVKVGDVILVVDVGGGTTDLSLIAVAEEKGALVLHRVAVGDHILLGGDNMDLALAHTVRQKMEVDGRMLDSWQLGMLTHACRSAKELLLNDTSIASAPIVVASRGSKLIGGSLRSELTREEVLRVLVEGFFPKEAVGSHPVSRPRGGLMQMGLPYAQDAAVTRHLAAFLTRQAQAADKIEGFSAAKSAFLKPTALLFNGGVFKAKVLRDRVVDVLNGWLATEGAAPLRILEGADLDLAVARGAAYYGYVRRGRGVRIRGGSARAYYIGVETSAPAVPGMAPPLNALCIAPFGMEEGTSTTLPPAEFGLVVGEPVRFRFFESSVRRDDQVGSVLERWRDEELHELREIEATLPADGRVSGEVVPVRLSAAITEVGTLLLEAVPRSGADRWKLELDVRETSAA
jgi:hypothetical protein